MRYVLTLAAFLTFITLSTSQAFGAAGTVPAFGTMSASTGGKANAGKSGTNTLNIVGATVGTVGGRPTLTITGGGGASTPIATSTTPGKVKPDGTSTTVDADGTIHSISAPAASSFSTIAGSPMDNAATATALNAKKDKTAFTAYSAARAAQIASKIGEAPLNQLPQVRINGTWQSMPVAINNGSLASPTDNDKFGYARDEGWMQATWATIKSTLTTAFNTIYHGITITWAEITGAPTDNAALATALGSKKDKAGFANYSANRKTEADSVNAVLPSIAQKAALAGTNGTPSGSNKYVTSSDPRFITPNGIVKGVGGVASTAVPGTDYLAPSGSGGTWVERTLPVSATYSAITWNGSIYCAVATGGAVITSPDGITWTARGSIGAYSWTAIAWNGTRFCAVASGTRVTATSPDGITWTQNTLALPPSAPWSGIAANASVFVAVAGNGTVATSPDGVTWTVRTAPITKGWSAVTWNGSVFCAVAVSSTQAITSPDGITWTARTVSGSSLDLNSVVWNGSVFCAVGTGGAIATSADGVTWATQTVTGYFVGYTSAPYLASVAWNGSVLTAVGPASVASSADNGATWVVRTNVMPRALSWWAIASNGRNFCALGGDNTTVATTVDFSAGITGNAAFRDVGTVEGTVAAGDDERFSAVATATTNGLQTAGSKARDLAEVSILDYIPPSLHAGIRARTDTTNLSSYLTAAIGGNKRIRVPAGKYNFASSVTVNALTSRLAIEGDGSGVATFNVTNDVPVLVYGSYNGGATPGNYYSTYPLYNISLKGIEFTSSYSSHTTTHAAVELRGVQHGEFSGLRCAGLDRCIDVLSITAWTRFDGIEADSDAYNNPSAAIRVIGNGDFDGNSTGNIYSNTRCLNAKVAPIWIDGQSFGDIVISGIEGTGAVGAKAGVYINANGSTQLYADNIGISNIDMDGHADAVVKVDGAVTYDPDDPAIDATGLIAGGNVNAFFLWGGVDYGSTINGFITTAVASPGSDQNFPTEKAVRAAINTAVSAAGGGNVSGPASAVDGHLAVFDGTTGKLLKDGGVPGGGSMTYPAAGISVSTGTAWGTSKTAPSGTIVGDTDAQTLTNKTLTTPILTNGTVNVASAPTAPTVNLSSGGALTPSQQYCYAVTAIMGYLVETTRSTETCVTADFTNKTATVTWSAVTGATSYRLYRTTTPGDYTASKWQSAASGFADNGTLFLTTSAPPAATLPSVKFNNGSIGINVATPSVPFHLAAANAGGLVLLDGYNVSPTGTGTIGLRGARNTMSAPSAVQAGDALGAINFRGYGATGWAGSGRAAVYGYAEENYTDTAQGSYLTYETTAPGGVSRTAKLKLTGAGRLLLGTTLPTDDGTSAFQVKGNVNQSDSSIYGVTNAINNGTNALTLMSNGSNAWGVTGWVNAGVLESNSAGGLVLSAYNSTGDILFQTGGSRVTGAKLDRNGVLSAKQFQETVYAPTSGSSFTVDLTNGTDQELTTNANTTITLPTPVAGKSYTITVKYGGVHSVTFAGGGTLKWPNATVPTATSITGKYDIYVFKSDATGTITFGSDGGRNF